MSENLNFLFLYLEKEYINLDKTEFEFQLKSHPDYPSLLAIVDTLTFFGIHSFATRLEKTQIDSLPLLFIALINDEFNVPNLYLVEKKEDFYIIIKDTKIKKVSDIELEQRWLGIILLIEKSEKEIVRIDKNIFNWAFIIILSLVFGSLLYSFNINFKEIIFLLFPFIGFLFSIAALKELFGTKSKLIDSFCNLTTSTNCATIVSSGKWKIFKIITFSDLGIVFFYSHFLSGLFFVFSSDTQVYFTIQYIILISSFPILFLSVYYQKYVEKKWCPLCLAIISLIILELFYLFAFQNITFNFSFKGLILFVFILLSVIFTWSTLKNKFSNLKELKEFQLKAIRFERNYTMFKNSLLAGDKIELPQSPIVFGNKESNTIITVISNPFCGHCKEVHEVIETLLEKHHNDIQIRVILKTNLEIENEEGKKLFRSLMKIFKSEGEAAFIEALRHWFDNKKLSEWFDIFPVDTTKEFDSLFNYQYKWCEENEYNFTPTIFVNGYEYPQFYNRKNLPFYINELIEDNF